MTHVLGGPASHSSLGPGLGELPGLGVGEQALMVCSGNCRRGAGGVGKWPWGVGAQ